MRAQKIKSNLFLFISLLTVFLSTESTAAYPSCGGIFAGRSHGSTVSNRDTQNSLRHFDATIKSLYETSGFKNNQEIIRAAEAATGAEGALYRQALEILRNEDLMVGTRLSFEIRDAIVKKGFLNFHETQDSQGTLFGRTEVETTYANLEMAKYEALPHEMKPKYAAAYPKPGSNLKGLTSLESYTGTDRWYFKMDRIRERITVTPGDSLNRFVYWQGQMGSPFKPSSWDQAFIPWEHRYLLIPEG